VLSSAGLHRCGTSLKDGASDYLGLLARRREPYAQVEQRSDVDLWRWVGCSMEALGSRASLPSILMATSEMDP
jgi:hypothetical protein